MMLGNDDHGQNQCFGISDLFHIYFLTQINRQPFLMQVQIKKRPHGRQNAQQTDLELEFKIKIPSHIISNSSNIVVSGQMQPQGNTSYKQSTHKQPVKDKKLIAQRLLSKKSQENREHHAHDEKQKDRPIHSQPGSRIPEGPQAANYREPRQRTRENQPKGNKRQPSPQPVQTKQYPSSRKMTFLPKFNELDGIFTLGNQLYGLKSLSSAGFMIINEYPCSTREPSYIKFRVILPNPQEDDCGIGITYKPLDLIKYNIKKNPVKRCLGYYFASQKLLVEGLYYPRTIKYSPDATYRLIVNIERQQLILVDDKDIILARTTIPFVFLQNQIFVYLELKNAGKIQILQ